ncbi:4-hydroxybenzoate polyprenyl transferase [Lactarius akahatsu]|uniref:4-hydroxybenzoate polyprenyltransferase, mitochondrial n=1 Tax=Lactarius akahatsu TaxID=416441 RepID=A0AAD4L8Y0_9AGAM|nr:4-hydroxybenzoate polyprenyl transferase [Lactarius akahatsu]KAH8984008.1 4-hydroxybenzoate polyprenyl transferase [Lactarius akahatsu]
MEKPPPPPDFWRWIELSRVHKFAGSMLIFWPCAWGMTMAARSLSLPLNTYAMDLTYGLVGAALLHSAGCVWNDILDREFDRQVERTKHRPVADGRVSVPGALVFLVIHLVLLLAMLWHVNSLAWKLGLVTVFPLAGIYPLMKRVTYWPQAWLGVAMNMISLVAWSALHAQLPVASGALIFGLWCWTLYYDTIYACQDKRDDVQAGVKSTALLFGAHVKKILAVFAGLLVTCLAAAGALNNQGIPYFILTVGGASAHLTIQLRNLDVDDPKSCLDIFESNGFTLGEIVWGGLFVDYVLG